ncbi:polyphosphate kinase 2 family protein [Daejeonella sp.]|uniref:polyphosphate kinase 2 family protein n=1 Tax=Daejeonella sp. TaxID=2805397 RepID=UPI0030BB55F2
MEKVTKQFKVSNAGEFKIKDHDPKFTDKFKKDDSLQILADLKLEMESLQDLLYAANKHSLLIIFQAMDAAGKDSAIKHTMSGLNPQGCQVYSFKQPSAEELDHDFLWRHSKASPERGRVGIHNRSHYENVLVCKVHPEYILSERIASVSSVEDIDEAFWSERYESIRTFEKHLCDNGTVIIKFFLNVSKEEQKKRFLERIEDPLKHWKFSSADLKERELWDEYMAAYENAIRETSFDHAPWYVIPADKKWFSRIAISQVIIDTLKSIKMTIPELSDAEKAKLEESKARLISEI